MKLFQELTEWDGNIPNHAYYLSDDKSKMYAYIKAGDKAVFEFKKPYRFDARGRKFKEIPNTLGFEHKEALVPASDKWEVKGSKGDVYIVQKIDNMLQCTCSGFKFRGNCKHVKQVEEQA